MAHLAQCPADKMGTQARFHANNTRRHFFKLADQCHSLDLAAEYNFAILVKTNKMKNLLANIDADGSKGCGIFFEITMG